MAPVSTLIKAAAALAAIALPVAALNARHEEEDYDDMGPMDFMWPSNRGWLEDSGMDGPCGGAARPEERTEFPLRDGGLSLEQKQEVFDIQLSISFAEDPSSEDDFEVVIGADTLPYLDFSHVCLDMPSFPSDATSGRNATLQLMYTAEVHPDVDHRRHLPVNETFYVCSDVTLVAPEVFTFDFPCFNITGDYDDHSHGDDDDDEHDHDHDHDDDDDDDEDEDDDGHGHVHDSGISGGTLAGIIIGPIVAVALIAAGVWYWNRRSKLNKKKASETAAAEEKAEDVERE